MTIYATVLQVGTKTVTTLKSTNWITYVLSVIFAFLAPLLDFLYIIAFLLVVDMITSIAYQYTIRRKDYSNWHVALFGDFGHSTVKGIIESGKLRTTVAKLFFYMLTIICIYWFEIKLIQNAPEGGIFNLLSITNISAILICSVEIISILENVSQITNNPIFNVLAKLFKKKVEDTTNIRYYQHKH